MVAAIDRNPSKEILFLFFNEHFWAGGEFFFEDLPKKTKKSNSTIFATELVKIENDVLRHGMWKTWTVELKRNHISYKKIGPFLASLALYSSHFDTFNKL